MHACTTTRWPKANLVPATLHITSYIRTYIHIHIHHKILIGFSTECLLHLLHMVHDIPILCSDCIDKVGMNCTHSQLCFSTSTEWLLDVFSHATIWHYSSQLVKLCTCVHVGGITSLCSTAVSHTHTHTHTHTHSHIYTHTHLHTHKKNGYFVHICLTINIPQQENDLSW